MEVRIRELMRRNSDWDISSEDKILRFCIWIDGEVNGTGDEGDSRAVWVGGG